jgi:hypothetical protein
MTPEERDIRRVQKQAIRESKFSYLFSRVYANKQLEANLKDKVNENHAEKNKAKRRRKLAA